MNTAILRAENLRVTVPRPEKSRNTATLLLDDISFVLQRGEILGLTGQSGCGKSTLMRVLCRLQEPDSGRIWFSEQDWNEIDTRVYRRRVCLLPQIPVALTGSVEDNLRYVFDLHRDLTPPEDAGTLLDKVRLPRDLMANEAVSLSVGEKQRLALARVLALRPQVLLLDEPTSALDVENAEHIIELICEVCHEEKLSAVMTSHIQQYLRITDRILRMKKGRLEDVAQ
jgi:putative ABC transport system ATP-binding protein